MSQSTSTPAPGNPHFHTPNAWYEANGHLSAARAVASVLTDSLPTAAGNTFLFNQINHLGDLIAALSVCLDACAHQMDTLEQQINQPEGVTAS